jgi:hypothetical protein
MSAIVYTAQWLVYSGSLAARLRAPTLLRAVTTCSFALFRVAVVGRQVILLSALTAWRSGWPCPRIESVLIDLLKIWNRSIRLQIISVDLSGTATWVVSALAVITSVNLSYSALYLSVITFTKCTGCVKSRELRRLDSVSKSPLYSIYEEAISMRLLPLSLYIWLCNVDSSGIAVIETGAYRSIREIILEWKGSARIFTFCGISVRQSMVIDSQHSAVSYRSWIDRFTFGFIKR